MSLCSATTICLRVPQFHTHDQHSDTIPFHEPLSRCTSSLHTPAPDVERERGREIERERRERERQRERERERERERSRNSHTRKRQTERKTGW